MQNTSEISTAVRVWYGAITAIFATALIGVFIAIMMQSLGANFQPVPLTISLTMAFAALFAVGAAFPNDVRKLLISSALSEPRRRYDDYSDRFDDDLFH